MEKFSRFSRSLEKFSRIRCDFGIDFATFGAQNVGLIGHGALSKLQLRNSVMTNTDVATKTKKERVAKHEYLGADGALVDTEEEAFGTRYTLIGVDEPFEWSFNDASEDARRMLAIFGAKTLQTNESSGVRNNEKLSDEESGPEAQMAAIKERFALIADGQWADRTREGVTVKIDKDALAHAISIVLVAEGKKTQADIDSGHKAKIRQKLEDDPQFVKKSRQVPQVATEYAKLVGKSTATVDDLNI